MVYDKANGDSQWKEAMIKEVYTIMGQKTFEYLEGSYKNLMTKRFIFAPLCIISDVKQDGHSKARFYTLRTWIHILQ